MKLDAPWVASGGTVVLFSPSLMGSYGAPFFSKLMITFQIFYFLIAKVVFKLRFLFLLDHDV